MFNPNIDYYGVDSPTESTARKPQLPRVVQTTHYAYGEPPSPASIVKVTYSAYADFAARNAFYALSQNKYGSGVVEIIDTGNFNELCTVLYRDINGSITVVFKRDPIRPKLTLG